MTNLLRGLKDLSGDARVEAGKTANEIKAILENLIEARTSDIRARELERTLLAEKIDVSLPGLPLQTGGLHPSVR